MLFNSFAYVIFLPVVFIVYWIIPQKYRWMFLLVASYYFYMNWNPKYVFLILGTTIVSYCTGIFLENAENDRQRRIILLVAIVICIGILMLFKYCNFILNSAAFIMALCGVQVHPITINLLLPVGISFYVFQTLSYVIDVYRGDVKAERHLGYYAAFVSFFPQLVAGPIERTNSLLPQIKAKKYFSYDDAVKGTMIILWGYYKKIVIADTLAQYVDRVYGNVEAYTGFSLILIMLFFSIQIYCDFSGYSDIALGTAKLFGINLMVNFRLPYCSTSLREFWGKWHISLSTWFKDYIYIPLGGSRCSKFRSYLNLMITFLISGLWHGANWTFVVWGGVHGAAQVLEKFLEKYLSILRRKRVGKLFLAGAVFVFCNIAWVFFRAENFSKAWYVLRNSISGVNYLGDYFHQGITALGIGISRGIYLTCLTVILSLGDILIYRNIVQKLFMYKGLRWWICIILGLAVILFSQKGAATEFVYFQF